MAEDGHKVTLNVYDLSQGLARQLSTTFLGKTLEGIWHTGIVVYGNEYFFGGGIQHTPAGTTPYGSPIRVVDLGVTHVPQDVFEMYLQEISPRYTAETYSLLTHNCNNFSNEVSQFLVGATIPEYILQLPNEVISSPMGALMLPMIQNLETTMRAGAVPQAPQFKPPSVAQTPSTVTTVTVNKSKESNGKVSTTTAASVNKPRESDSGVKSEDWNNSVKSVAPAANSSEAKKSSANGVIRDPLGDARNKVQEEIGREFAALMATGSLGAGEAATLATKRVMERYGHLNVSAPRS